MTIKQHNDKWYEGTHVYFTDKGASASGKTRIWEVLPEHSVIPLGTVKWFGRWRKYSFFPELNTVYEQDCLRDIAEFCETITRQHRENKRVKNIPPKPIDPPLKDIREGDIPKMPEETPYERPTARRAPWHDSMGPAK